MDQQKGAKKLWPAIIAMAIVVAILWTFLAVLRP
jgi:hypothetical protein